MPLQEKQASFGIFYFRKSPYRPNVGAFTHTEGGLFKKEIRVCDYLNRTVTPVPNRRTPPKKKRVDMFYGQLVVYL
jgi:hypothetical protein